MSQVHQPSNRRRVWHPAIPTPPSAIPPTEFSEFTETTGEEYSPTDFTDVHRWLGCVGLSHRIHRIHRSFWQRMSSHGIHGIHRSFWQRIFSHGFHRFHRIFWLRIFSHRFHRCPQIFRLRFCLLICAHPCNLWEF